MEILFGNCNIPQLIADESTDENHLGFLQAGFVAGAGGCGHPLNLQCLFQYLVQRRQLRVLR